jgi:hypothetical protein
MSSKCQPPVPGTLAVPSGNKLAFSLDAIGVQIYSCNATAAGYAWTFVAPEASLLDPGGDVAGSHYAGPTWEGEDGSKVKAAKVSGYTADPTSIPWLLLQAVSHEGEGRMSKVSYIQRLDTVGGLAPASGCDASHVGDVARVDYTATYYFFEPSQGEKASPTCE